MPRDDIIHIHRHSTTSMRIHLVPTPHRPAKHNKRFRGLGTRLITAMHSGSRAKIFLCVLCHKITSTKQTLATGLSYPTLLTLLAFLSTLLLNFRGVFRVGEIFCESQMKFNWKGSPVRVVRTGLGVYLSACSRVLSNFVVVWGPGKGKKKHGD